MQLLLNRHIHTHTSFQASIIMKLLLTPVHCALIVVLIKQGYILFLPLLMLIVVNSVLQRIGNFDCGGILKGMHFCLNCCTCRWLHSPKCTISHFQASDVNSFCVDVGPNLYTFRLILTNFLNFKSHLVITTSG